MFPSSGLFAGLSCPFLQRHGRCERPHCLFRHDCGGEDEFGGDPGPSVVDLTGDETDGLHGAPKNDESTFHSLHEIQKINQEIETMQHEVEQERQRLSCYKSSKQSDRKPKAPKGETTASCVRPISVEQKKSIPSRKYVVDNSKPRTDLEYDPMSNFSSALRSYNSSSKPQKPKIQCNESEQAAAPKFFDELSEDGVVVIDEVLSEGEKSYRVYGLSESKGNQCLKTRPEVMSGEEKVIVSDDLVRLNTEIPAQSALKHNTNANHGCVAEKQEPMQAKNRPTRGSLVDKREKCPGSLNQKKAKKIPSSSLDRNSRTGSSQPRERPTAAACSSVKSQTTVSSMQVNRWRLASQTQATQRVSSQASRVKHTNACSPSLASMVHPEVACLSGQTPAPVYQHSYPDAGYELLLQTNTQAVIEIKSSSDEDCEKEEYSGYSDVELSDSDPMEECYRIFMEANHQDEKEEHPDVTMREGASAQTLPAKVAPQVALGKRRVAHDSKSTEPPAKTRPQPQVLVPLREHTVSGFGVSPTVAKIQQQASTLTASVKAGQAFVSAMVQKTHGMPAPIPTQAAKNMQAAPVQSPYVNCLPVGTAVIEVGDNLHLILPHGAFPLPTTATSNPVSAVLTPVPQSGMPIRHMFLPHPAVPVPRMRSVGPVVIPALECRSLPGSASASTASPAAPPTTTVQQTTVKPLLKLVSAKCKYKQQAEPTKEKVPHNIRQRYVNMFTEEILKTTGNVNEAFQKALCEEKTVYNRSTNKLKYLSVAINALKRLKNQSGVASKNEKEVTTQKSKGNIPLNLEIKEKDSGVLYQSLMEYALSEERMGENNYPVKHPEKRGFATLLNDKRASTDPLKRICCRCGATFAVGVSGNHTRKEECNYHYGKGVENRVPGGVETRYSCCQGVMGAPGCQLFKLHVHDSLSMDGFVSTSARNTGSPGIYALDCEMCYTVSGLELSRVTVVDSNLKVIYDTFVKPEKEVIDYNTRFSGISENDVRGNDTSLKDVQRVLLSFISADSILIGHELETDLCLLKLLHGVIVDTSVVFPHRLGPPHKLSLNHLTAEYLRKIIQESVCGHDTAEDAAACMELMLWKVKEDGKMKR